LRTSLLTVPKKPSSLGKGNKSYSTQTQSANILQRTNKPPDQTTKVRKQKHQHTFAIAVNGLPLLI
jgi:hypothetical protein